MRSISLSLYLILLPIAMVSATSWTWAPDNMVARAAPVIIHGKEVAIEHQEWDEHGNLKIKYIVEVIAVPKNIISDLSIKQGDQIEVIYYPDTLGLEYGKEIVFKERESGIYYLSIGTDQIFYLRTHPGFYRSIDRNDELKKMGAYEPVDMDGERKTYTMAEWNEQSFSIEYVFLEEPVSYPVDWPTIEEEAVDYILKGFTLEHRWHPIIYWYAVDRKLSEMGLVNVEHGSSVFVNKKLLRSMGRVSPLEAKHIITEAVDLTITKRIKNAVAQGNSLQQETYNAEQGVLDLLAAIDLNGIVAKEEPLGDLLNRLADMISARMSVDESGHTLPTISFSISPDIVDVAVTLTIRKVSVKRTLSIILQSAGRDIAYRITFQDSNFFNAVILVEQFPAR